MITKIPFALVALLFGLFLVNCSGNSPDDSEQPSSSSDDTSLSSSQQANVSSSSSDDTSLPPPALKAEPVAAVPPDSQPDVLYSWTDENKNYHIINVGHIKNSLLMENGFYYSGVGYMGITATEMTETSMAENRTNTVSNSIVVSTGSTNTTTKTIELREAIENNLKIDAEGKISANALAKGFVKGSIKASVETTINESKETNTKTSSQISNSFETSTGRTTEASQSFEKTIKESWSNSISLAANSGNPAGYYRYALYVVSDVYFIISTSLDNQDLLSWEVVSIPREKYELRQEYSPKEFNDSLIDNKIIFAEDFYKTLPKPTEVTLPHYTITANAAEGGNVSHSPPNQITYEAGAQITVTATPNDGYAFNGWTGAPSGVNASSASITFAINSNLELTANFRLLIEKTEIKEFTAPDTFTFDKKFPATVEIYALGAGGGGQGGHRMDAGIGKHYSGVGAAGGGAAAVYYKTTVNSSTFFNINVGKGGTGGNGFRESGVGSWNSGYPGIDGGSTSVTWNNGSNSITANGGKLGGGGDRYQGLEAGSGGGASNCNDCISAPGEAGTAGERGYSVDASKIASKGGNSGAIYEGSIKPFGNGLGAERQSEGVVTRLAGYGGGGFGGYNHTESGSNGGDGFVVIVVTYYE